MLEYNNINVHIPLSKIAKANFKDTIDGKKVELFFLTNQNGLEVCLCNYGVRVISLMVPDKNGKFEDVVLGFNSIKEYKDIEGRYFGSIIGQYANRIEKGIFSINNKEYTLDLNEGENHLHGGSVGYNDVVWNVLKVTNNTVTFQRSFDDGQNGYPGNLDVQVTYTLTEENELKIEYEATTDTATIINLSHHSYFNLKGEGKGSIKDHVLKVNADYYTPINKELIPNQGVQSVIDSPFDFRETKVIGENLKNEIEQIKITKGYDHNYVLKQNIQKDKGLTFAAQVKELTSGRVMDVYTSEPGVQFYSGNFLNGTQIGKSNEYYYPFSGFCLETQHFPNSPNTPDFPCTCLQVNDTYKSSTIYKFSTIK